ncbi:hypothetical protein NDU88_003926 [Pleurodeles waltl]|uniref:Uncharacterized protein n=1 Tax=Pleurodeles waltl TaxID=8319 RepID=A0AAV7KWA8_PLEWA|nr:hypothetical protein NDU88_003926 [Pleurodeles waltl]
MGLRSPRPPAFTYRFRPDSFLGTAFRKELVQARDKLFHTNVGSVAKFATVYEVFKVYIWSITKHTGILKLRGHATHLEVETADIKQQHGESSKEGFLGATRGTVEDYYELAQ